MAFIQFAKTALKSRSFLCIAESRHSLQQVVLRRNLNKRSWNPYESLLTSVNSYLFMLRFSFSRTRSAKSLGILSFPSSAIRITVLASLCALACISSLRSSRRLRSCFHLNLKRAMASLRFNQKKIAKSLQLRKKRESRHSLQQEKPKNLEPCLLGASPSSSLLTRSMFQPLLSNIVQNPFCLHRPDRRHRRYPHLHQQ